MYFAQVALQMPTDKADQLVSMVEKYPDVMERFYQTAIGLDNDDPQKSLGRYMSSDVMLIDKDKYNEECTERARMRHLKEAKKREESATVWETKIAQEKRRYKGLPTWRKLQEKKNHNRVLQEWAGFKAKNESEARGYAYRADHVSAYDQVSSMQLEESAIIAAIGAKREPYKHGPYGKIDKPAAAA